MGALPFISQRETLAPSRFGYLLFCISDSVSLRFNYVLLGSPSSSSPFSLFLPFLFSSAPRFLPLPSISARLQSDSPSLLSRREYPGGNAGFRFHSLPFQRRDRVLRWESSPLTSRLIQLSSLIGRLERGFKALVRRDVTKKQACACAQGVSLDVAIFTAVHFSHTLYPLLSSFSIS